MRTASDLDAAFALLERQADDYTAANPDDPGVPVELVRAVPSRSRSGSLSRSLSRSRGIAAGVAAAAAAAAVVVALALGAGSGEGRNGAANQGPTLNDGPAPRSIPVTVAPGLAMRILEVTVTADSTIVDLYSRSLHAEVTVFPKYSKVVAPGLQRVEVNGHTGYYDDGTSPGFVQQPGRSSTAPPPPAPTPPDTPYAHSVIVEYRPHAYAFVLFQGRIGTKADLLRVARGIRFGGRHPLRSAVSLSSAPARMHLAYLDSTYRTTGDNAPFDLTGNGWYTLLNYLPHGTGHGVHVEATSYDLTPGWHGGQATTLGGHRAYWFPKRHELDVDFGNGAYLDVSEVDEANDGKPLVMTQAQIEAVTRTVTLTAHPTRPSTWFDAGKALP